jgi:outer membrane immunogenic protein
LRKFAILFGALAFSASALAADIAPKMFVKVLPPVYSWSGFYIGGNVDYGWGNANDGFAFNAVADPTGRRPLLSLSQIGTR